MSPASTLVARLYEHIEPIDRGERYEDPLDAALRAGGLGEVTGGGSQLTQSGEIEFADVEIRVGDVDEAVATIVQSLEQSGAPVGSELLGERGLVREFGRLQSVAVYLDGVSLPDEVYAALDFEATVEALTRAAGDESYHGYWQGPEETGLFFFGSSAEDIFARVDPVLRAMPIGQNARVVIRPSRDQSRSRAVRLPRH
jgi:hypothetical protein